MTEVDPGSYVEVQMDRQAVVLAAVGVVVLLVLAFMLGRWTAPDAKTSDPAAAADEAADDDEQAAATIVEDESMDGEPMFGSRPVTAAGAPPVAPPVAPVPAPSARTVPPLGAGSSRSSTSQPATTTSTTRRAAATTTARRPRASAPAPVPAAASGAWLIQVAAVREQADADGLKRKLEGKGYPVRIVSESGLHKVQVGPYVKKSEAQVVAQRLEREEKLGTWLKPT